MAHTSCDFSSFSLYLYQNEGKSIMPGNSAARGRSSCWLTQGPCCIPCRASGSSKLLTLYRRPLNEYEGCHWVLFCTGTYDWGRWILPIPMSHQKHDLDSTNSSLVDRCTSLTVLRWKMAFRLYSEPLRDVVDRDIPPVHIATKHLQLQKCCDIATGSGTRSTTF